MPVSCGGWCHTSAVLHQKKTGKKGMTMLLEGKSRLLSTEGQCGSKELVRGGQETIEVNPHSDTYLLA
jgi:hypothetical protein